MPNWFRWSNRRSTRLDPTTCLIGHAHVLKQGGCPSLSELREDRNVFALVTLDVGLGPRLN